MKIILIIGIGSFLGGIARYLLTVFIQNKFFSTFPYGTLVVNIIGCFAIGIVYSLSEKATINHELKMFATTGILGGFTTFSSFSYESVSLFRDGRYEQAFIYTAASIVLGLGATFAGFILTKSVLN